MYFHGGVGGKKPGDLLVPSAPHVVDGCPICVARAQGRSVTVGEYRRWVVAMGGDPALLKMLQEAPDDGIIDPPTPKQAVYVTTDQRYARFYAARSRGDLYQVEPMGDVSISAEDPFSSRTCLKAKVVKVIQRRVALTRSERRSLLKAWKKKDKIQSQTLRSC